MTSTPVTPRVFPPLYSSSGDAAADRLAFFHILERLKTQKRTGWVDHKVSYLYPSVMLILDSYEADSQCREVISDHMYRMSILAMCTADAQLDVSNSEAMVIDCQHARCVMMCVVHDLAEAQVGDIAPREGIPKSEKRRLEAEAMHNFTHEMLHNSPAAQKILALWQEYEDGETVEARFVKDLDRFEMASQALEYEREHGATTLQPFFDSSIPNIRHPEVQGWAQDLLTERQQRQAKCSSEV